MKRLAIAALCACLATTAFAVAPAIAGKSYKTTTSIVVGNEKVEGKLSSAKPACLANRLVRGQIFAGGPPAPLGNLHTNSSGHWEYKGFPTDRLPPHYEIEEFIGSKSLGGGSICEARREKKVFH